MTIETLRLDGSHEVQGWNDSIDLLRTIIENGTRPTHLDIILKAQESTPAKGDAEVDVGFNSSGQVLTVFGFVPGVMIAQAWVDANPHLQRAA